MTDEQYMARALSLAARAIGHTHPNPMVGAVVVKDGQIVGEGYHHKAGQAHAEVNALNEAGALAEGATLYVTLEPCAHYGKTPPCAKRVIEAGVSRVVISVVDPNPLVGGKGIAMLEAAGIEVTGGILADTCAKLIEGFLTYIKTKKPFITLKSAMSLDGKIATKQGESQWITNECARKDGHVLRASHDAILVGIGTVLADNPTLNTRLTAEELCQAVSSPWIEAADANIVESMPVHQPDVIVLDSVGRTPSDGQIFSKINRQVHIFVGPRCEDKDCQRLTDAGGIVHMVPEDAEGLSIEAVLTKLGELGYTSVLVEGGSHIIANFMTHKSFNKLVTYVGNILIGGQEALSAMAGEGISYLKEAPQLQFTDVKVLDNNLRIEAYLKEGSGR